MFDRLIIHFVKNLFYCLTTIYPFIIINLNFYRVAVILILSDEWRGSESNLVGTNLWRDHDGAEGARLIQLNLSGTRTERMWHFVVNA
jgi:hypothetical protein